MLGRSLLDVGPISLTEDGLDADQAEDRYAAWVAPYHLPEEGGAEPGLSKATPPRHSSARSNVVAMAAARANTTREVLESPGTVSWKTTGLHRMNLKGMIP